MSLCDCAPVAPASEELIFIRRKGQVVHVSRWHDPDVDHAPLSPFDSGVALVLGLIEISLCGQRMRINHVDAFSVERFFDKELCVLCARKLGDQSYRAFSHETPTEDDVQGDVLKDV